MSSNHQPEGGRAAVREWPFQLLALAALATVTAIAAYSFWPRPTWNEQELTTLGGLWLESLPPLPADPSNQYADDPQAAALGHQLFFDTRFSGNGQVACATCHLPTLDFQDGRPLAQGMGQVDMRTMPLMGVAYSPWLFWDGRKDSLWAQALGPLENPVEHGGSRVQFIHLLAEHYRAAYEAIFGPLPDISHLPPTGGPIDNLAAQTAWQSMSRADQQMVNQIFANMGKAISAYERLLLPGPARFDAYAAAVLAGDERTAATIFTPDEIAGLRLFMGRGNCIDCHNGPLLTNNDFHNTGVPARPDLPLPMGRALGVHRLLADEFNCLGRYSDADPTECGELRFISIGSHQMAYQLKPPSLRNVAERPPYMHAGQIATLAAVIEHYNSAPPAPLGHTEIEPLGLTDKEKAQLLAFLQALTGPLDADPRWLAPPP
jgi:cytochrome c peroxidase